jgi:hypothetical protein
MRIKKQRLYVLFGLIVFVLAALNGVQGLAREGESEIYLPVIFGGDRDPVSTPTNTVTAEPTVTDTLTPEPTATFTSTPIPTEVDVCAGLSLAGFTIEESNRPAVSLVNESGQDVYMTDFRLDWESAQAWGVALGYDNMRIDWFDWEGLRFYDGDDYDSPTSAATSLLLTTEISGTWRADLDFSGEQLWSLSEEFGLTSDNFGFWVQFDNGCVLYRPETISLPPELDCDAYSVGDFYFGPYGHVLVDLSNGDFYDTQITSIELGWSYAEAYDEAADPADELNVDFMIYGGRSTWGNGGGGARDYDSTTHTNLDSPETFPGDWSTYGLPPFDAGVTYTLDIEFDEEWASFADDLLSDDFGLTIEFENGCVLEKAAIPRPLPTPDCGQYSISEFEIDDLNRIQATITNSDIISTEIERIVLDWDYAEALSDLKVGPDDLYVDYFIWDNSFIWSNNTDTIGDFSSVTDSIVDTPEAWAGPKAFSANDIITFGVDFDFALTVGDSASFTNWGVLPSDFGATFYFKNGCVLEKPAMTQPMDVVLVLDISESMSWDAPSGDLLRDPSHCNDTTLYPGSEDAGECHP